VRIGVIGTGNMGTGLARAFARAGHDVMVGSRDPERGRAIASGFDARGGAYEKAAAHGDAVVLAVPWWSIDSVIPLLGDLEGKIAIDVTNPTMSDSGLLQQMHGSSGAEVIAREIQGATLVKCFNHISAEVIHLDTGVAQTRATAFLCGDEPEAKNVVSGLARDLGYDPVDVGPLAAARLIEPLAALVLGLAQRGAVSPDRALALVPLVRGRPS